MTQSGVRSSPPPVEPWGGTGGAFAQHLLDHTQEDRQYCRDCTPVVSQEIAQPLRQRSYPLAHRQRREDMIDPMRRRLHPAPGVARRIDRTPFAGIAEEKVMAALRATRPGEARAKDSTPEVTAEFPLDVGRYRTAIPGALVELAPIGLEVRNRCGYSRCGDPRSTHHRAGAYLRHTCQTLLVFRSCAQNLRSMRSRRRHMPLTASTGQEQTLPQLAAKGFLTVSLSSTFWPSWRSSVNII
jgi:hypothetical protein